MSNADIKQNAIETLNTRHESKALTYEQIKDIFYQDRPLRNSDDDYALRLIHAALPTETAKILSDKEIEDLAHELWPMAQLNFNDGIEDAIVRMINVIRESIPSETTKDQKIRELEEVNSVLADKLTAAIAKRDETIATLQRENQEMAEALEIGKEYAIEWLNQFDTRFCKHSAKEKERQLYIDDVNKISEALAKRSKK